MNGTIIRALVALLLAAIFWRRARGARGQPKRRRAFELVAAACLVFATLLGLTAAGVAYTPISIAFMAVAVALVGAAALSLLASFRGGEMGGQGDQIAQGPKENRERRGQGERKNKP